MRPTTSRKPAATPVRHRRQAVSYREVMTEVRTRILAGEWPPGARLPTHQEWQAEFHTTPVTVQRAVRELASAGFVRTAARAGAFVADRPPHLTDVALVFPQAQHDITSRFFQALRQEAAQWPTADYRLTLFYELSGHRDVPDFVRLNALVAEGRVAGIIFAANPYGLKGTPLREAPGIPRVVIASDVVADSHIPCIYPDRMAFFTTAFRQLRAQGRRRVAVLLLATTHAAATVAQLTPLAAAAGLELRPQDVQGVALAGPEWAHQSALAMFSPELRTRPDALVIADDNLLEPASAGLLAAGLQVPRDVGVVALANFPWPTPSLVPVRRLGVDARQLLAGCLDLLAQQRRGATPPPVTLLAPQFDDELTAATPVPTSRT